jgi:hypothetical protein
LLFAQIVGIIAKNQQNQFIIMKKILGLGLLALAFASCSDDDGPSVNLNELTKKWYFHSYVVDGEEFPYEEDEELTCAESYLEFKTDNTTVSYEVYGCDGDTPVAWTDNGTYSVEGNQLTANLYGDGNETATITELTSSTLKISYEYTEDGVIENYTEVLKSTPH